ncbi:MAG TPA: GNAT family N-acetyltransferase [Thermomicrobiales bacterium]|nr:GNAT family N-acetyltransferase [Thermomicrobiales bacterium]
MTDSLPQPQLHMRHNLAALPDLTVPAGYDLRRFTADDGPVWGDLMNENGELGEWDTARIDALFAPESQLVPDGSFFITHGDRPVATAQLDVHRDGPYASMAELGWVAARPGNQGLGLGYVVCLAVMRYARAHGYPELFLRTDDPRLPAIATYLKLGFTPWMFDPTAPERWDQIRARLNERRLQQPERARENVTR